MHATHEEWRPVPGYEGSYEVSSLGRVRSIPRVLTMRNGQTRTHPGRLLKPRPAGRERMHLQVVVGGRPRYVHRLVLLAFHGPAPAGMQGCHNDGNSKNNRLDNLRWDTGSNNRYDSVRHGTHPMASKTRCNRGHEYTPENTLRYNNNGRTCRACETQRLRQRYLRDRQRRLGGTAA